MAKYEELVSHLETVPEDQTEVTLTMAEIEGLIEAALPSSARAAKGFWANRDDYTRSQLWLAAGWRVVDANLDAATVTFGRSEPRSGPTPRRREVTPRNDGLSWRTLLTQLNSQPEDVQQLSMTFGDMERLLGGNLPTACRRPSWWFPPVTSRPPFWNGSGWLPVCHGLDRGQVEFLRVGEQLSKRYPDPPQSPNERLADFLAGLPQQQVQVALTFSELEKIRDTELPPKAKTEQRWWANNSNGSQVAGWTAAGWKCDHAYLEGQLVVFRQQGTNPLHEIRRYVASLVNGSTTLGRPGSSTLAEWLRLCRQITWYFEGTVIYERSGAWLDGLPDAAMGTIEEDYDVCKRELTRYESRNGSTDQRTQ